MPPHKLHVNWCAVPWRVCYNDWTK
jgi:hypothetical protein